MSRLRRGLWQTGEHVLTIIKDGCCKAKTQVHSYQVRFFKSTLNPNFYMKSPCFVMLTTNSNLQHCVSQTNHICKLNSVHEPSVCNLCHRKKKPGSFSANLGVESTRPMLPTQYHLKIHKIYEYTSETRNCWRKARNHLTLHTVRCSISSTRLGTINKIQWKKTLENKFLWNWVH